MTEIQKLNDAVDVFAQIMKRKLISKKAEGKTGWDDPDCLDGIREDLLMHAARVFRGDPGQAVDVANLAMMVYFLRDDPYPRFRRERRKR